jgi:hypothetical protein
VKQRYAGRVRDGLYEVVDPSGAVVRQMTLDEARADAKLAAAIERNGWEKIT